MTDVDVDELRAKMAALMARAKTAPTPTRTSAVEPERQPRQRAAGGDRLSSWRGQPQSGTHLISTHNHGGHMTRDGAEYRCECGQEWVYLADGDRPPRIFARPYRGSHRALPYGSRTRGSLLGEDP